MDSELLCEVVQRVKAVRGIESFLVLPVAALQLAVVARRVGADKFVADTQLSGGGFKEGRQIPSAVKKRLVNSKPLWVWTHSTRMSWRAYHMNNLFQKICGGIGGLLRVGSQEAQTGELINSGVLEQAQLRVGDAAAGHHLHIHLDPLTWVGHLLVGFGLVGWFLFPLRKQSQLSHHPEQALLAAGIAPLPQTVP